MQPASSDENPAPKAQVLQPAGPVPGVQPAGPVPGVVQPAGPVPGVVQSVVPIDLAASSTPGRQVDLGSSGDFSLDVLNMLRAELASGHDLKASSKFAKSILKSHKKHYLRPQNAMLVKPQQSMLIKYGAFLLGLAMLVAMLFSPGFPTLASTDGFKFLVSAIGVLGTVTLGTLSVAKVVSQVRQGKSGVNRADTDQSTPRDSDTSTGGDAEKKAA